MSRKASKRRRRQKKSAFKSFFRWLVALCVIVIVGFVVREFVAVPVSIAGDSMMDTYQDGDIVLATRFDYILTGPDRGDVVLCTVDGRDGMYVKRVVALPGDYVELTNGMLTINGTAVHETYVTYPSSETMSMQLGEDQYMVLGDNRANSYDSRETDIGMLSRDNFEGKVRCGIWPLGK